jgi:hypothetical protein
MRTGDPAPYDGQLVTTNMAIALGQAASRCNTLIKVVETQCQADAAIDSRRCNALRVTDQETFDDTVARCTAALGHARAELDAGVPWYKSPWLWAPVSAIVSGTAVAFAVSAATSSH